MAIFKVALFFAICFSLTHGLSFLKKQNMHSFVENAIANGKKYNGQELIGNACLDSLADGKCESLKPYCRTNDFIRDKCPKTCGVCQSAPPLCGNTALGCCWDNITTVEIGKKCPACEDANIDCKLMKLNCSDPLTRRLCPVKCGVSCGTLSTELCLDDKHQAEHCPGFRDLGICESDPDLMKEFCRKTCKFC